MPIPLKDFTSFQTPKTVHVTINCPTILSTKTIDIFHSDKYVKVSHPPYIFELFFEQSVKVSDTKCVFQETKIDFEFFKEEENNWRDVGRFNFELRQVYFQIRFFILYLNVSLSLCLSLYLSVSLSICLSIYL